MKDIDEKEDLYTQFIDFTEWFIKTFKIGEKPYKVTIPNDCHSKVYLYFKIFDVGFDIEDHNKNIEIPEQFSTLISSAEINSTKGRLEVTLNAGKDAFIVVKHKNPKNYFGLELTEKPKPMKEEANYFIPVPSGTVPPDQKVVAIIKLQLILSMLQNQAYVEAFSQYLTILATYFNEKAATKQDKTADYIQVEVNPCDDKLLPAVVNPEQTTAIQTFIKQNTAMAPWIERNDKQVIIGDADKAANAAVINLGYDEEVEQEAAAQQDLPVYDLVDGKKIGFDIEEEVDGDGEKLMQDMKATQIDAKLIDQAAKMQNVISENQRFIDTAKQRWRSCINESISRDFPSGIPDTLDKFNKSMVVACLRSSKLEYGVTVVKNVGTKVKNKVVSDVSKATGAVGIHPTANTNIHEADESKEVATTDKPDESKLPAKGSDLNRGVDEVLKAIDKGDWMKQQLSSSVISQICGINQNYGVKKEDFSNRWKQDIKAAVSAAGQVAQSIGNLGKVKNIDSTIADNHKSADVEPIDTSKDIIGLILYFFYAIGMKKEFASYKGGLNEAEFKVWDEIFTNVDEEGFRKKANVYKQSLLVGDDGSLLMQSMNSPEIAAQVVRNQQRAVLKKIFQQGFEKNNEQNYFMSNFDES